MWREIKHTESNTVFKKRWVLQRNFDIVVEQVWIAISKFLLL